MQRLGYLPKITPGQRGLTYEITYKMVLVEHQHEFKSFLPN